MKPERLAIVVDRELPIGLLANAVAAVSLSIGHATEGILGDDAFSRDGKCHPAITALNIPILASTQLELRKLYIQSIELSIHELMVIAFTSQAQTSRSYDEYSAKLSNLETGEIDYIAIGLAGTSSAVKRFTGSLPLVK